MLRIWLRRRRLLLLSGTLTLVFIPFLIFTIGINTGAYVIGADDDAYDYDAIAGVHAMVHQMGHNSKSKRDVLGVRFLTGLQEIRAEERSTYKVEEENDLKKRHGYVIPSHNYVSSGVRGPARTGIFRRKIQDSEDVPPDEIKGYSFLQKMSQKAGREGRFRREEEMYQANEDEDDYGENDGEEDAKEVMKEAQEREEEEEEEDYKEEGENAYDYWSRNTEFQKGDFDDFPKNLSKTVLRYEEIPQKSQRLSQQRHLALDNTDIDDQYNQDLLVRSSEQRLNSRHNEHGYNNAHKVSPEQGEALRYTKNCDPRLVKCNPDININNDPPRVIKQTQHNPQTLQKTRLDEERPRSLTNERAHAPSDRSQPDRSTNPHTGYKEPGLRGLRDNLLKDGAEYAHSLPLHEQPATQLQMPQLPPQQGEVRSNNGFPVVTDKIYWSKHVEKFVPTGITQGDIAAFQEKIRRQRVTQMVAPLWNRCGRPKNQYVVLEDGSAACARYRAPHTKMIQGEILSFYLARLLGIDSVPVCTLAEVNATAPLWRSVEPARAGWEDGQLVVLIQWIDGLDKQWSQVKMPPLILSAYQRGATVDRNHPALRTMSGGELAELLQWSDLIIYDYITGHYDRVASMQDGAEREQKKSIMSESIRNLRKVPLTNKLWFVDNESGLFDGYELMKHGKKNGPRFIRFHQEILQTMCLYRRHLVERIEKLAQHDDPQAALTEYTQTHEPLYSKLPSVGKIKYFKKFFHSRLKDVVGWIEKCRSS